MSSKIIGGIAAAVTIALSAGSAQAQDANAGGGGGGGGGAAAPKKEDNTPDHEKFIGHLGVTYFDIANLPLAGQPNAPGAPPPTDTLLAPIIGVRYWLDRNLGIDGGIGIGWTSGSLSSTPPGGPKTDTDKASPFGIAFHAGVPIALAHAKHYSFLVIPEANIGFANRTVKFVTVPPANPIPDLKESGFLFSIGARVGAEIHFGFIGVPELALQGSVGLFLARTSVSYSQDTAAGSDGTWGFGSTVGPNPWALFVNSISATYYF
jgi:hypothetical protein